MKTVRITKTLRLRPELIQNLEILASKENRNFNNLVETILQKAIKVPSLILSLD